MTFNSIESGIQYLEAIDEQSTEFEQIEHFPRSGEQHERKCDRSTVLSSKNALIELNEFEKCRNAEKETIRQFQFINFEITPQTHIDVYLEPMEGCNGKKADRRVAEQKRSKGSSYLELATLCMNIILSSGTCVRAHGKGRMCSYTLGRDDPTLRALDDVFLSKENRNFYTARLGISLERAAPSIDKPSGRICNRHLGKSDVYPLDTPDRLFTKLKLKVDIPETLVELMKMGTCWFAVWVLFVCLIGDVRPQYRDKNITNPDLRLPGCTMTDDLLRFENDIAIETKCSINYLCPITELQSSPPRQTIMEARIPCLAGNVMKNISSIFLMCVMIAQVEDVANLRLLLQL
ncbi:hypothetical protein EAG_03630 [Camponotus floridanus]|uniref:Uncharacterized protein n=1 Tax=Camponotus floridanus TaxID=104421 RepID=E2AP27_CAMFO|nr:hypothetical protein EAG_03630 [Camponotus floridanus]